MSCCVIVPVYKQMPSYSEEASLRQVIKVLPAYKIVIVCGKSFDATAYTKLLEECKAENFRISRFSDSYFSSLLGYNKLLLSFFFYRRFHRFNFMLIYQLDAWIFKNDIEYWCNEGYDYIGSPWFSGFNTATTDAKLIGVGNGGFSLRKISSHIKVLTSFSTIRPFKQLWNTFRDKITIRSTVSFLLRISIINNTFFLLNDYTSQEDHFWGLIVPKKFKWFKIPDSLTASKFAMEVNADQLYELNNQQLPVGCHAWEKYDPDFWKRFIKI